MHVFVKACMHLWVQLHEDVHLLVHIFVLRERMLTVGYEFDSNFDCHITNSQYFFDERIEVYSE
jgi:hypothetical protein